MCFLSLPFLNFPIWPQNEICFLSWPFRPVRLSLPWILWSNVRRPKYPYLFVFLHASGGQTLATTSVDREGRHWWGPAGDRAGSGVWIYLGRATARRPGWSQRLSHPWGPRHRLEAGHRPRGLGLWLRRHLRVGRCHEPRRQARPGRRPC
jgi:hypothetical protein